MCMNTDQYLTTLDATIAKTARSVCSIPADTTHSCRDHAWGDIAKHLIGQPTSCLHSSPLFILTSGLTNTGQNAPQAICGCRQDSVHNPDSSYNFHPTQSAMMMSMDNKTWWRMRTCVGLGQASVRRMRLCDSS